MKRITPFFAVLCMGLVAAWGMAAWRPPTVAAYYAWNDDGHGKNDDGYHHDKDHDDGCRSDDSDRDKDQGDHDRKDKGDEHGKREGDDGHDRDGRGHRVGTFLVTITNYGTGATHRSVIALHRDHTMSAIDSNQNSGQFSSQLGAWKNRCDGRATGRTLEFSFGDGTITRLDYKFDPHQPRDSISGTIVATSFALNADPLGDGGTAAGEFEFTGTRVEAPPDKDK